ncbi:hypothetical protein HK100_011127 [Physocladia obscura]|uniref:Uncharacterized protein n=1 Tax=Physocladia obscura TaxID=109957 RepID=A0AAD5XED0_9FUNG|nr:hypothetical protein HK100_011127 [Physocladia obscura]
MSETDQNSMQTAVDSLAVLTALLGNDSARQEIQSTGAIAIPVDVLAGLSCIDYNTNTVADKTIQETNTNANDTSTNTTVTSCSTPRGLSQSTLGQRKSSICHHAKRRSQCVRCKEEGTGGSIICKHFKQKYACRWCFDEGNPANSLCEHRLIRAKCKVCTPVRQVTKSYRPRFKMEGLTPADFLPFKNDSSKNINDNSSGCGNNEDVNYSMSLSINGDEGSSDHVDAKNMNLAKPELECMRCSSTRKVVSYGAAKRPLCKSCHKHLVISYENSLIKMEAKRAKSAYPGEESRQKRIYIKCESKLPNSLGFNDFAPSTPTAGGESKQDLSASRESANIQCSFFPTPGVTPDRNPRTQASQGLIKQIFICMICASEYTYGGVHFSDTKFLCVRCCTAKQSSQSFSNATTASDAPTASHTGDVSGDASDASTISIDYNNCKRERTMSIVSSPAFGKSELRRKRAKDDEDTEFETEYANVDILVAAAAVIMATGYDDVASSSTSGDDDNAAEILAKLGLSF